jgi:hypothetical protein
MAISPVTILSVTDVGNPVQFLRVRFEHPSSERANLARFAIHVDEVDDPPVWTEPPAVDLGIPQDDGGSPMEMREVLWWIDVAGRQLDRGGGYAMWDGAAVVGQNDLGLRGTEDFEDYPVGVVPVLDAGIGWDGAADVSRARWMFAVSGTTYVTATSVSETVPASVQVGDLLLAFVMHRDDVTAPAGWTLVANGKSTAGSNSYHALSVFKRTAQNGDAGATVAWTIPTSRILGAHLLALPPGMDVVSHNVVVTMLGDMATTPVAPDTLTGDGIIIAAFTAAGSATPSTITAPAGYTLTTPATTSNNNNKLGVAVKLSEGEVASGNFALNLSVPTNGGAAITLIIKEVP